MDSPAMIRVVLADDHPLIMAGFAAALANYGVTVVGQTGTPEDAVRQYQALAPDVLVLDIRFGSALSGLDVARQVLQVDPRAHIVFLSQFDQEALIQEAYRLGAHAFLSKVCSPAQLAAAIRSAHEGHRTLLPDIAERLAQVAIQGDASPQSRLGTRELEIFTLMAQGCTNAEIATQLHLSPKTISNTSQLVKDKLGARRTATLTRLAVKHGLIEP